MCSWDILGGEERMHVMVMNSLLRRVPNDEQWYALILVEIESELELELHEIPNDGKWIENENCKLDFEILKYVVARGGKLSGDVGEQKWKLFS